MGKHSGSGSARGRCLFAFRKPGDSKDLINILVKASRRETPGFSSARKDFALVKTTACWKCVSKALCAVVEEGRRHAGCWEQVCAGRTSPGGGLAAASALIVPGAAHGQPCAGAGQERAAHGFCLWGRL